METKINSEKIISPEAVNVWMERQGFSYDANKLTYSRRTHSGKHSQLLLALYVPRPASDPYFLRLAADVGTPHAEMVDALYELTQEFVKKAQTPNGPEEPKAKPIQISAKEIEWWLHRNGWVEASFGERTCWVRRHRRIEEFQSILAHLQRFHGPWVTPEDITEFLHPKIEIPDDWIDLDAPYLEILSRQTNTPIDQLTTALRKRTEPTERHG